MKNLRIIYIIFTSIIILTACKRSDPQATLHISSSDPIEFSAIAGFNEIVTIDVTTDQKSWDVRSNQNWCTVTKSEQSFTIAATTNTSSSARVAATITITASDATSITILVTQKGANQQKFRRTLIAYMAGNANGLSSEVYTKIRKICEGWQQSDDTRILIYLDADNNKPQLREVDKNVPNSWKIIRQFEDENSSSGEVFSRVIQEVKTLYPSESYGMLVFSHASGWLPQGTLIKPRSITMDHDNEMELTDFAAAIPDKMLDFIVFEPCFMSGIEVMYELKNKANYILGSSAEMVSPGFTEIYANTIKYLFEPQANLVAFAEDYFNLVNDPATGGRYDNSATISVIKTSELDRLAQITKTILRNAAPLQDIMAVQHFDRYPDYRLFFDFNNYFYQLATPSDNSALTEQVERAVIYKAATPNFLLSSNGFEIKKHSGLTTYIMQERFPFLNGEYKKLKWYKAVYQ